jgi:CsoR family transcriptional regulator, copper-sensing transcriptional repressor
VHCGDVGLHLRDQIVLALAPELEAAALSCRRYRHRWDNTPSGYRYARNMSEPTRGYTATKDQLDKRLRRIEGQVRGIQRMVDEDRYCIDVVTQIAAVQAALDKVALGLLDDHSRHCIAGGEPEELSDELMGAVARLRRRG